MRKLLRLTSAATGLALLGASAWLVASAALMPPLYTLALGITTVRACGIGRAVFRYGERYLSHRMAFRILTEIRLAFYDAAARCLPLRSGPARQGEFLHDLMAGADDLRDFYVRALLPITAIATITALTTWLLARVLGPFALLLPVLGLVRLRLAILGRHTDERERRARDAAYRSALLDAAGGANELICAGAGPAAQRLAAPANRLLAGDLRLAQGDARRDAMANLLDAALLLVLFALLICRVTADELSGIDLCVWFLVLQALLAEFRNLPEDVRQWRRSLAAAKFLPDRAAGRETHPAATSPGKSPLPDSTLLLEAQDRRCERRGQDDALKAPARRLVARWRHTAPRRTALCQPSRLRHPSGHRRPAPGQCAALRLHPREFRAIPAGVLQRGYA